MIYYPAIVDWCATEVERQGDGPLHVTGMFRAWDYASNALYSSTVTLREKDILVINDLITLGKHGVYRRTPATFLSGGIALGAEFIPRQMTLLLAARHDIPIDEWTKRFLDIHPFADGNGRTAAVLYNVLHNRLTDPLPLPDFYRV